MYCIVLIFVVGGKLKLKRLFFHQTTTTLKCILDIKDVNYQIDFAVDNSLANSTGF